ncbi:MAG TPA: diaminopimelate epimerase [Vicinamibacteria bacterium]|nr:diaminopimelate epimerase [Vicinamibacteria bacterium]
MHFAKAHGLGNDFILVPEADAPAERAAWARRLCDRHLGIGGDGVIVYGLEPDTVRMRLVNADGSDGEVSGNGVRCLAAFAAGRRGLSARHVVLTPVGPRPVSVADLDQGRYRVSTGLGPAILESGRIPVALDPPRPRVVGHPLEAAGQRVTITATSLGNPHCAVFVDTPATDELLATLGPALERHAFFPRRTNVEFVTVEGADRIRVRFWERGVGYTRASGTGAASAVVASVLNDRTGRRVTVACDGGTLEVEWPEGGEVRQVGEVEIVFEGRWTGPSLE